MKRPPLKVFQLQWRSFVRLSCPATGKNHVTDTIHVVCLQCCIERQREHTVGNIPRNRRCISIVCPMKALERICERIEILACHNARISESGKHLIARLTEVFLYHDGKIGIVGRDALLWRT